jgi:D-alanyl-D-alanine carboxypeptidase
VEQDQPLIDHPRLQQRLSQTVQQTLAGSISPGISAAVLLDGESLFISAAGYRDIEKTTPLEPQDKFYIYSTTKSLIAAVILRLVEGGRIDLDAPVQVYLPQLGLDKPVTLRQLLNHTGGVPDYGGLVAYFEALKADPKHPWNSDRFLTETLSQGVLFEPGQGWAYSNIGYLLLRQVIEKLLGKSLRTALQEQLFAPLGLSNSFVAENLEDARALTPGYSAIFSPNKRLEDVRALYHPGWVSHGVVISTASDLASVNDEIFSGRLIDLERRAAMLEAVPVQVEHPLFQQPGYGLGVMIDTASQFGILAGHGGGGPGYSAGAIHLPDVHGRRITAAALANCDQGDLGLQAAFQLAREVAGSAQIVT